MHVVETVHVVGAVRGARAFVGTLNVKMPGEGGLSFPGVYSHLDRDS